MKRRICGGWVVLVAAWLWLALGCPAATTNYVGDVTQTNTVYGSNRMQLVIQRPGTSGTSSNGLWYTATLDNVWASWAAAKVASVLVTNVPDANQFTVSGGGGVSNWVIKFGASMTNITLAGTNTAGKLVVGAGVTNAPVLIVTNNYNSSTMPILFLGDNSGYGFNFARDNTTGGLRLRPTQGTSQGFYFIKSDGSSYIARFNDGEAFIRFYQSLVDSAGNQFYPMAAGTNIVLTTNSGVVSINSSGGTDSTKLPLAGGTMTGNLGFSGTANLRIPYTNSAAMGTTNHVWVGADNRIHWSQDGESTMHTVAHTTDTSSGSSGGTTPTSYAYEVGSSNVWINAANHTNLNWLNITINLTNNLCLNVTNAIDGQMLRIRLRQDSTGNRTFTGGGPAPWGFGYGSGSAALITGVVLSTNANAVDYLTIVYDSTKTNWHPVSFGGGY